MKKNQTEKVHTSNLLNNLVKIILKNIRLNYISHIEIKLRQLNIQSVINTNKHLFKPLQLTKMI
ncbi:Uncharacterised protein [Chlamydia trachomatis]|nr:Uncharacterised protein [Chlamydia trachomatis]